MTTFDSNPLDKMKVCFVLFSILIVVSVATPHLRPVVTDELRDEAQFFNLAEACDTEACQLPDCRCSSTDIPGGLEARDTPQFVTLTWDDGVNVLNFQSYESLLFNRLNSNGCPIGSTFYVSHEYTNYQLVNELYNNNFEIALHSISHVSNTTYWAEATYEDMANEFGGQIEIMSHFANIPAASIKGVRLPFLQMTGNASFQVMADYGLEYDCSWPTINNINPGLWPYTLDYASTQECVIPPCPTASIPGLWILPMISWLDDDGVVCSMVDSCYNVPSLTDADAWFAFIVRNFELHYLGNRSPFGFYIHEGYVASHSGVREGLRRFMDMINRMNDVFMVNSYDVIKWTRNPVPLDEYVQQSCSTNTPVSCNANSCGPLPSTHNQIDYWMQACTTCPSVYPWLGNPLGTN